MSHEVDATPALLVVASPPQRSPRPVFARQE